MRTGGPISRAVFALLLSTLTTHTTAEPNMADPAVNGEAEEELVDYEEEEVAADAEAPAKGEPVKKGYVGIHSSGFKDFLLKPELIRAIVDCGFEHPSEGAFLGH